MRPRGDFGPGAKPVESRATMSLLLLTLLGGVSGCGRSPTLAKGPIDVSGHPTIVRFVQPVESQAPAWELCFEFDLPRDSHHAGSIRATLVSPSGARAPIRSPSLDRRGESTVCQIGEVATSAEATANAVFDSVELQSEIPLRLRGIRGGVVPTLEASPGDE